MVEPFKNNFNENAIRTMANAFASAQEDFDQKGFITFAIQDLDDLELKQRSVQITAALDAFLPKDFPAALAVLIDSFHSGLNGWAILPMADYVALRGQNNVELALDGLKILTPGFSCEFALRPFLLNHQDITLNTLSLWVNHADEHVRRLVSEGTRPRLPWGQRLGPFVAQPAPLLPFLERLKDDPSAYVRRSVANHLNDISKDHPDLVAELAQAWMIEASTDRKRLVRHALRTLIKAGHCGALQALGYEPPQLTLNHLNVSPQTVHMGEAVAFDIEIASTSPQDQPLILDYAIHHVRANGKRTAKVFKWKTLHLKAHESLGLNRRHAFKPITTRRYYSGQHGLEILINGQSLAKADFDLIV